MGVSGRSVNDIDKTDVEPSNNLRRVRLFAASLCAVVLAIFLIPIVILPQDDDGRERDSMVFHEEVEPYEDPFHWADGERAFEEANARLRSMTSGSVIPLDRNSRHFSSKLFRDDFMGFLYWEFDDGDVNIWVNADTGEIISYSQYVSSEARGNMSGGEALELARSIANQFAPLPLDRDDPTVAYDVTSTATDVDTGEETQTGEWFVLFNRTKDGVVTSDSLWLRFADDGTLQSYHKDWYMDLSDTDTTFTVTRENAGRTAVEFLREQADDENITADSCIPIINLPVYGFVQGDNLGTDPLAVWQIELTVRDARCSYRYLVQVHGRTPDTVITYWF